MIRKDYDMTLQEFELPEHWASLALYGDEDGMDEDDLTAYDAFVRDNGLAHCVEVVFEDGGNFVTYHDARRFGVLACNVAQFFFAEVK